MPQVRANRIDIEYESFGRESDPAVLLIMGFSAQMTMWPQAFCEGLAADADSVGDPIEQDLGRLIQGGPDLFEIAAVHESRLHSVAHHLLAE